MADMQQPGAVSASPAATAARPQAEARIRVALAGNPNSGKTTLFNLLTGCRQGVGNYPGVTVEKKEGVSRRGGARLDIVDLPGTYSLAAYSTDERVARDFLLDERPDVVVCVVDASNLERSLYLTVQLMELGAALVLALNMTDLAAARGFVIDVPKLSGLLGGVPVVPTVGNRGTGCEALVDAVVAVGTGAHPIRHPPIPYGDEVDEEIEKLAALLEPDASRLAPCAPRWAALKLLEGDGPVRDRVRARCKGGADILAGADASVHHLRRIFADEPEVVIADRRYGFAAGACREAVRTTAESRRTWSDRIDSVVAHPLLGLPIFLSLMYLVFFATFRLGEYPMHGIHHLFQWLAQVVGGLWPAGSGSALESLLVDGVIGGVGGVIAFLPNILILFLAIAVLEDSGYMARAAFIVDRWMHKIGLHGKSFIPMLIGFGCTVPAIMATRILESRRDRLTTMLVLPLMSCGARLPIYVLLTGAFFAESWRAPVMWSMYLVGIGAAVLLAKILRSTLFRGEAEPFVMELPPYRAPTFRGAVIHTWHRGWLYVRKAGTVILGVSVLLWAMTSYPRVPAERLAGLAPEARAGAALGYSVAGRAGRLLAPVARPLGFDWRVNTALLGAVAAKEVFVAQMGIVHSLAAADDRKPEPLEAALGRDYTPLQGIAIMLFCLLGLPCVATIAVMWSESGSWKWALLQWGGLTAIAYAAALIVYQAGSFLGWGAR
jgi:ferrous iron transport protein B